MDEQSPPRVNRPVSFYLLLLLAVGRRSTAEGVQRADDDRLGVLAPAAATTLVVDGPGRGGAAARRESQGQGHGERHERGPLHRTLQGVQRVPLNGTCAWLSTVAPERPTVKGSTAISCVIYRRGTPSR